MAEGIERDGKPMNKVGEAETFLHEELKNGPRAAREMIELARQLGIGVKTLERAREKRGIVTSKAGKDAGWMSTTAIASIGVQSGNTFCAVALPQ